MDGIPPIPPSHRSMCWAEQPHLRCSLGTPRTSGKVAEAPSHVLRDVLDLTDLIGLDTVHRELVTASAPRRGKRSPVAAPSTVDRHQRSRSFRGRPRRSGTKRPVRRGLRLAKSGASLVDWSRWNRGTGQKGVLGSGRADSLGRVRKLSVFGFVIDGFAGQNRNHQDNSLPRRRKHHSE